MATIDFTTTLDFFEGLEWWGKLISGICGSLVVAFIVRALVWGPVKNLVKKTEANWDDDLIKLATPLVNYAVFLSGLYITILWSLDSQLTPVLRSTIATLLVIMLLFLIGNFLTRSVNKFLPTTLETLDKKGNLGLSGGTTIFSGLIKVIIWATAALVENCQPARAKSQKTSVTKSGVLTERLSSASRASKYAVLGRSNVSAGARALSLFCRCSVFVLSLSSLI